MYQQHWMLKIAVFLQSSVESNYAGTSGTKLDISTFNGDEYFFKSD